VGRKKSGAVRLGLGCSCSSDRSNRNMLGFPFSFYYSYIYIYIDIYTERNVYLPLQFIYKAEKVLQKNELVI
jgi:hypothetical protein